MTRGQENNEVHGELLVLRRWCLGLTTALGIVVLAGAVNPLQQLICKSLEVKTHDGRTAVRLDQNGIFVEGHPIGQPLQYKEFDITIQSPKYPKASDVDIYLSPTSDIRWSPTDARGVLPGKKIIAVWLTPTGKPGDLAQVWGLTVRRIPATGGEMEKIEVHAEGANDVAFRTRVRCHVLCQ
jgi:hypothetical protein